MAGFEMESDEDVMASINITPFVDVVLVLLIIFMVTSTAIVRASFNVKLPQAAAVDTAPPPTLTFLIDADGVLFLDGDVLPWDNLPALLRLRREEADAKTLQAAIAADSAVAYGRVVRLIDGLKQAGIDTFALNIERAVTSASATP